jgi:hypothetical protein
MAEALKRVDGLDIHEVPDGYIIYHGPHDNVCYLNKTAAIVFEFCDGKLDSNEIASRVAKIFELNASSHEEIQTCVDQLIKQGLIQSVSKS